MRIEFPLHFQLYSGSLYYFLRGPMNLTTIETPVAWWKADLESNCGWVFSIDDATRANLTQTIKATYIADKPLFEYTQEDFDLGPAWATIATTIKEVHHGHGLSLMQNLPHDGLSEQEFKLMNWVIDLHAGVARPQGLSHSIFQKSATSASIMKHRNKSACCPASGWRCQIPRGYQIVEGTFTDPWSPARCVAVGRTINMTSSATRLNAVRLQIWECQRAPKRAVRKFRKSSNHVPTIINALYASHDPRASFEKSHFFNGPHDRHAEERQSKRPDGRLP